MACVNGWVVLNTWKEFQGQAVQEDYTQWLGCWCWTYKRKAWMGSQQQWQWHGHPHIFLYPHHWHQQNIYTILHAVATLHSLTDPEDKHNTILQNISSYTPSDTSHPRITDLQILLCFTVVSTTVTYLAVTTAWFTFAAMHRYLKKRWWEDQNCPHIVFFMRFSASTSSAASWNLCMASTHWTKEQITAVKKIKSAQQEKC